MNRIVLDASAILAVINGEPGVEKLTPALLARAVGSAVSLAEVQTKLVTRGWTSEEAWEDATSPVRDILPFDDEQARMAGDPHFRRYPEFLENAEKNLKQLADAGIPYGFGTDAGPPGRFPGYAEHWEMELLVEAGLTPSQAIQAATRNGAQFLKARDLGTLEKSKWADLIVLEKNPLADIKNTRTIHSVYIAGNRVR